MSEFEYMKKVTFILAAATSAGNVGNAILQGMKFSCTKCGISNLFNAHSKCYTSWFRSEHGIIGRGLPVI